jgi:hypothetical protein
MAVLWLRFLREVREEATSIPEDLLANETIRQAVDICEESAFTPAELAVYDKYWDAIRTEKSVIRASLAEGEAKGRAEGEAKSLINVVCNCRRNGFTTEQIRAITGLEEERIMEIIRGGEI